ncbi:hypothetical protein [Burkholderia ubonensis]|uniref:hypothetical protein n=1 Tax=Burkholderia ubonensis TaxID=101571 RepID=UPI0007564AC8|nr:hypothetical protein [Burkholderia ubonensis]KVD64488.1 hypothetical protein WI86_25890 [Burkholderia ubonensis]KVU23515.1 hypothetical protein WK64_28325 [Burkholderia ubonensis]
MKRHKANIIDAAGLADWLATEKLTYANDQRNGKRLVLDTFLSGDLVVTFGDEVLYRGDDVDAAVDAFNDAG